MSTMDSNADEKNVFRNFYILLNDVCYVCVLYNYSVYYKISKACGEFLEKLLLGIKFVCDMLRSSVRKQ